MIVGEDSRVECQCEGNWCPVIRIARNAAQGHTAIVLEYSSRNDLYAMIINQY
jgi:hypothetical protein